MPKEKFDAVQVLRALAAALVVFQHGMFNWAEKALMPGAMPAFPHLGDYGVKLFFCISGFIIVHTSASAAQGWESAETFWRRRMRRIVPLYWIVTTVYLVKLCLSAQAPGIGEVVRSYLFIPYLDHQGMVRPILGQGWSLDYEMLFYLVFGAMFFLPMRWRVPGVVAVISALAMARYNGLLGSHDSPNAIYHWADSIVMYFAAGVVASALAQAWRTRGLPALSQGAAAFVSVLVVVGYAGIAPTSETWFAYMPLACIAPLLLCITAKAGHLSGPWHPVVVAGDASYSTYLTHGFVMGPLARVLGGVLAADGFGYYGFALLCVVVCTMVGHLIYLWVERPLQRGKSKRAAPIGHAGVVADADHRLTSRM